MKSTKEILVMLINELNDHLTNIETDKVSGSMSVYYNEILGDTSFLLAGLLSSLLKKSDWDEKKWIDDSLITNFFIQKNKFIIEGIMIWGRINTTRQWTDPFSFEIEMFDGEQGFKEFNFLFCDKNNPEISYENFSSHRDYWEHMDKKWKYIIKYP